MNKILKLAFEAEMACANRLIQSGLLDQATWHVERAHVLGQRYVMPHVQSHWSMLKIALKRSSIRDIGGQIIRIVLGALGSAVGVVPLGNTGGTNVSMFARLPVDKDLAQLLNGERHSSCDISS